MNAARCLPTAFHFNSPPPDTEDEERGENMPSSDSYQALPFTPQQRSCPERNAATPPLLIHSVQRYSLLVNKGGEYR